MHASVYNGGRQRGNHKRKGETMEKKDAQKRDNFLTAFATWLLEECHAQNQQEANRKSWDFVTPAWDGNNNLDDWTAAYNESLKQELIDSKS